MNTDPFTTPISGIALHGLTPFDTRMISHIEGNLYQGGCEDGLILPEIFEHVISLYAAESYTRLHPVDFVEYRLYDDDVEPDAALMDQLAAVATARVADGPTLIHCQAGLNRSGLVSAMVLMNQGRTAAEAIALLRERRSPAVLCNPAFERWLLERPDRRTHPGTPEGLPTSSPMTGMDTVVFRAELAPHGSPHVDTRGRAFGTRLRLRDPSARGVGDLLNSIDLELQQWR